MEWLGIYYTEYKGQTCVATGTHSAACAAAAAAIFVGHFLPACSAAATPCCITYEHCCCFSSTDAKDLRSSSKLKLGQVGAGSGAPPMRTGLAAASPSFPAPRTCLSCPDSQHVCCRFSVLLSAFCRCLLPAPLYPGGGRLPAGRQDVCGHAPRPARRRRCRLCAHGVLQSEGAVRQVGAPLASGLQSWCGLRSCS